MVCPITYGDHKYNGLRYYIGDHNKRQDENITVCPIHRATINSKGPRTLPWNSSSYIILRRITIIMAALRGRCGHCFFALWFLFIFIFFLSSPNLSGRRLDVYHTSTRGVALQCEFRMQVWNVLHAARWKCRTQKKSSKIAIWAPSHNFVGLYLCS